MIKIKRAAWTADLPLHFQARLYDLNRQLLNARSETKIKHHEGIKWENKSTEFLDTTSITKSNSDFPTFPSENTKTTGKRGENGEKTGRKGWNMSRKNRETILAPIRSEGLVLATPKQRVVAAAPTRPGHGPTDVTSLTNTLNLHEFIWIHLNS